MIEFGEIEKESKGMVGRRLIPRKFFRKGLSPETERVDRIRLVVGLLIFIVMFLWGIFYLRELMNEAGRYSKIVMGKGKEKEEDVRGYEVIYKKRD